MRLGLVFNCNRSREMIMNNLFKSHLAVFALIIGFSVSALAQTAPGNFPNVHIRNFGQMDANYYRGAQPKPEDYQALKALGITTVIDLQDKPTKYEKAAVEGLGIAELHSFSPVEVFRGGSIEAGKYSALLSAKFQSMERTLREDEVAEWAAEIVAALQELGGAQRA